MKKLVTPLVVLLALVLAVPVLAAPPQPGELLINEVMQNPSAVSDSNGEWFEVKNMTGATLELDGCVVSDAGSDSFTIAANTDIAPGEYFVFCNNADSGTNGGLPSCYEFSGMFIANGDDEIIITCGTDEIDRIEYDGGPNWPDPTGGSMAYNRPSSATDPDVDVNNSGANWADSSGTPASSTYGAGDYGTPGAINHDWMDGQDGRPTAVNFAGMGASFPVVGIVVIPLLAAGLVVLRKRS